MKDIERILNWPIFSWIDWEYKDGYPFHHDHLTYGECPEGRGSISMRAFIEFISYALRFNEMSLNSDEKEFLQEQITAQCRLPKEKIKEFLDTEIYNLVFT